MPARRPAGQSPGNAVPLADRHQEHDRPARPGAQPGRPRTRWPSSIISSTSWCADRLWLKRRRRGFSLITAQAQVQPAASLRRRPAGPRRWPVGRGERLTASSSTVTSIGVPITVVMLKNDSSWPSYRQRNGTTTWVRCGGSWRRPGSSGARPATRPAGVPGGRHLAVQPGEQVAAPLREVENLWRHAIWVQAQPQPVHRRLEQPGRRARGQFRDARVGVDQLPPSVDEHRRKGPRRVRTCRRAARTAASSGSARPCSG